MTQRPCAVLLVSNGYGPDVRVQKEAHTLAAAGWRVTVIAWDRAREYAPGGIEHAPAALARVLAGWPEPDPPPVAVMRVRVPAGYRTGRRLAGRILRAWWRMGEELRRARPDVVHAHDLDTLPVALAYGRAAGVPVLFDAREYYPGMVRGTVGARVSVALDWLDRWLAPRADAVITVGERLADRYRGLGARVWVVHNSQPLPDRAAIRTAGRARRAAWGVPEDALLVVYVGRLTPDRLLTPLLEVVPVLHGVYCVVAGDGPQASMVRRAAAECSRIRALGWVPLDEVAAVVAAGDVVYYGLNARDPNSFYFMPNLAFFALGIGLPILTTPVGEIAALVAREGCGDVMAAATPGAALAALRRLADGDRRATLARRAAQIGQARYHWGHAAQQLLRAYDCVVNVKNC